MGIIDKLFKPNVEKLKEKEDVEGLIKAIQYEKDDSVRYNAAEALGKIGDARTVEPLIHALRDKDEDVREKAAEALENMGEPAVKPLTQALKDKDRDVQERVAQVLMVVKLQNGLTLHGRMNSSIQLPLQGSSFSVGELVTVTPHRLGGDIVVVTSRKNPENYVELSLYQVKKYIDIEPK
jgi:hypothetical protein